MKEDTAFPYITVGETSGKDWSTKTNKGMQLVVSLHVFSRSGGRKQALAIMERLHTLLHQGNLSLSGHLLVMIRFQFADVALDNDGQTYQGTLRMQALTESA